MSVSKLENWEQKHKERQKEFYKLQRIEFLRKNRNLIKWSMISALIIVIGLPLIVFSAYFFRNYNGQSAAVSSGNTIFVKKGGDFQDAIDRAKSGDTIFLEAGANFVGNFKLPKKTGDAFITIRTSATDQQLPPENIRIDPKKYAAVLPKISSATPEAVISTFDGAHHYRFIGIEFGGTKDGNSNIVKIGTDEEKRIEDLPHHIEFDRIYMRATSPLGQRRGIAANGKHIKIANSHIEGIRRKSEESQAIAAWATDGPIEIINNYLEGAAENILFGGGSSYLKLTPADCLVRDNHLNKPLEWINEDWVVKNFFEIKDGVRIKIENNLMTNNWAIGQDGTAILFSTRDTGHPVIIDDITFVNNIIRGSGNGISIYGKEGKGGHNLTIKNNFFEDIGNEKWRGVGFFMKTSAWDNLIIENNTIINKAHIANAYDAPVTGFVFRDNIVFEGEYSFKGDGTPAGQQTLDKFYPQGKVVNNIIVGGTGSLYREKNFYLSSIKQIGFENPSAGNYLLQSSSPYINKGTNETQIGAKLNLEKVGRVN